MRRRLDPVTGDPRRLPPTAWIITKAATVVLAAMPPAVRRDFIENPTTRRNWHRFRDTLHELDRRHGSRAAWLHAPWEREPPREPPRDPSTD